MCYDQCLKEDRQYLGWRSLVFGSEIGDGFGGDWHGLRRSMMVLSPPETNKTMGLAMAETRERIRDSRERD